MAPGSIRTRHHAKIFSQTRTKAVGRPREVISCVGQVSIGSKQAQALGIRARTPWSPIVEKSALRACAHGSYTQAQENMKVLMEVKIGHSSLHRLVNRTELPHAQGHS